MLKFTKISDGHHRAVGNLDTIYECCKSDGVWFVILTQYGIPEESPMDFATLRQARDWARIQDSYLEGI